MRSLQASRTRPFEILIVDNASGDGSADRLRESLERVRVVESPTNAGFSGGCNIGIRAALAAGAEYILLLNSDAVLAPDAIGHMAAAMAAQQSLGIAAPVLLSREEPDHVSSAGISFSRRTARMRHRAAPRVAALEPAVQIVDAVSGCVMLIRRASLNAPGSSMRRTFSPSRTLISAFALGMPVFNGMRSGCDRVSRRRANDRPALSQARLLRDEESSLLPSRQAVPRHVASGGAGRRVECRLCASVARSAAHPGCVRCRSRRVAPLYRPLRARLIRRAPARLLRAARAPRPAFRSPSDAARPPRKSTATRSPRKTSGSGGARPVDSARRALTQPGPECARPRAQAGRRRNTIR